MKGVIASVDSVADDPDCLIFDCRSSLADKDEGFRTYQAGHIPGALYADLERHLSSPAGPGGRHPLPDRRNLTERCRAWGISNGSRVICYDDSSGAFAGRLWWLLRWLGHDNVEVLDGGLAAWVAGGHDLATEVTTPEPGNFSDREPLTRTVDADDIKAGSFTLIDARDPARFRGEVEPIDPIAGHIPGAFNAPFTNNLEEGRFKKVAALVSSFESLGITDSSNVVCYCGSGVTATHNILAMKLAGLPEPALYPGSWSGWITDPTRPITTGE